MCRPSTRRRPTAVVLVGGFTGLGIHTVLNALRMFPRHFANLAFVSVGVLDSGAFKGEGAVDELKSTDRRGARQVPRSRPRRARACRRSLALAVGTDVVAEAEKLCVELAQEFPEAVFFAGKVVFGRERWYQPPAPQRHRPPPPEERLQLRGAAMVIIPARLA